MARPTPAAAGMRLPETVAALSRGGGLFTSVACLLWLPVYHHLPDAARALYWQRVPGTALFRHARVPKNELRASCKSQRHCNTATVSGALIPLLIPPRERPTALQGMPAMHLRRAQPCRRRLAAVSRSAAVSHASHPVSCWPRLTHHLPPLARSLLHIIQCLGAQSCPTPWQIFAHNPGDAYNFSSSLPHDARPHDQGCRHSRDKQRHRESRRR